MTTRPSSRYACDQARTYAAVRSQLMQVNVQKSTRTTRPLRAAGVRGSELSQAVAPSKPGMCTGANDVMGAAFPWAVPLWTRGAPASRPAGGDDACAEGRRCGAAAGRTP